MANGIVSKAAGTVGQVEVSRRTFLKLSFLTAFAAYEGLDAVCEVLNEATEPSRLDRIMSTLGLDILDRLAVRWFFFDRKLQVVIKGVRKVEGWIKQLKG